MEISTYLRIIRKNKITIAVITFAILAASLGVTLLMPPSYKATTQVFVSVQGGQSTSDLLQGSNFAQNRVKSYVAMADVPEVLDHVIADLGLDVTAADLAESISASSPLNTSLIDISAASADPQQAALVANAVARRFSDVVTQFEQPADGGSSPVKLTVVRAAQVPLAPDSPNLKLNLALGLLAGLAVGLGVAVLREVLDTGVRSEHDVAEVTPTAVVAHVPLTADPTASRLAVQDAPLSSRAESYRRLRTNLQFLELAQGRRSIVVTSSLPGEGKSTTTANLALALADAGRSVVLVDADLRRPSVARYFGLEGSVGLTTVLIGDAELDDVLQPWGDGRLQLLTSGEVPPNPSEMLGSDAMGRLLEDLSARFDVVLLDSPPLLPVTDAAVLGRSAGGVLVVASAGKVHKAQLKQALTQLETVGVRVLGVTLNRVPATGDGGYYYGEYRQSHRAPGASAGGGSGDGSDDGPGARKGPRKGRGAGKGPRAARAARQASAFDDDDDRERRVPRVSRRTKIGVLTGAGVVVLALGGAAAWGASSALTVREALGAAADDVVAAKAKALDGDVAGARALVASARESSTRASAAMSNPVLSAATHLPGVGDDLAVVRLMTEAVDSLTTDVVPGLLDALELFDGGVVADGRVDVAALTDMRGPVVAADAAVRSLSTELATISRAGLVPEVAGPVDELAGMLDEVAPQLVTAVRAVELLPPMLGADGPRTYLLAVQNSAEARSLGGIGGAFAVLDVVDGRVTVAAQESAAAVPPLDDPAVPLTEEEDELLGPLFATYPQNPTMNVDFPRAAEVFRAMWAGAQDVTVDGVLATDPVALARLLQATGPMTVPGTDVELTADNAVDVLLRDVYAMFESNDEQDAFFAAAAAGVFERLMASPDPGALLDALDDIADQGRLLVWSADAAEQERLTGTILAGDLEGADGSSPVVGVYLNDTVASKMTYYLETETSLSSRVCAASAPSLDLDVTLRSTAPDGGGDLSDYVTGYLEGDQQYNLFLYAPEGGAFEEVLVDDEEVPEELRMSYTHEGLAVEVVPVELVPGQELVVHATLSAGKSLTGDPVLRQTPGPRALVADVAPAGCTA